MGQEVVEGEGQWERRAAELGGRREADLLLPGSYKIGSLCSGSETGTVAPHFLFVKYHLFIESSGFEVFRLSQVDDSVFVSMISSFEVNRSRFPEVRL